MADDTEKTVDEILADPNAARRAAFTHHPETGAPGAAPIGEGVIGQGGGTGEGVVDRSSIDKPAASATEGGAKPEPGGEGSTANRGAASAATSGSAAPATTGTRKVLVTVTVYDDGTTTTV